MIPGIIDPTFMAGGAWVGVPPASFFPPAPCMVFGKGYLELTDGGDIGVDGLAGNSEFGQSWREVATQCQP